MNHPTGPASPPAGRREHWDAVYSSRGEQQVSWYQADPRLSAELITGAAAGMAAGRDSAVIDAGGGASLLAGRLAAARFTDVTVVDVSAAALAAARRRPGSSQVTWINADLLAWRPPRAYQIWHDRAVFHFLTSPADRAAYLGTLRAALPDGGAIILATFAADGPAHCSGLPVARYDSAGLAAELTGAYDDAVTITNCCDEQHRTPSGVLQPFTWITARLS
ncbi:MAG TPA: class I SAM-dependent methyltransferase [Streptosporangiaceae bacterium]|nr:class I SAM-dependent methyltransferase [Streptosporangiaceae bacterium]